MKKLLVICLSFVILFSATMTAFAVPVGFVSSPSNNPAPELLDYENDSEECEAVIVLTPYSQRDKLDAYLRELLEKAYEQIVNMTQANDFSEILAKLAKERNISVDRLAVSDLFDLNVTNCDNHEEEEHEGVSVTLKAETIKNFVGLLHYNNEKWEIVKVNKVNKDKNTITFHVDDLSPFVIVVDNGNGAQAPKTGDNSIMYVLGAVVIVSALAVALLVIKNNKIKKENI